MLSVLRKSGPGVVFPRAYDQFPINRRALVPTRSTTLTQARTFWKKLFVRRNSAIMRELAGVVGSIAQAEVYLGRYLGSCTRPPAPPRLVSASVHYLH
jgi:hypothetical protein